MSRLLRAFSTATRTSNSVSLVDGVHWPDMGSSVLFVRSLYIGLWEVVLQAGLGDDLRGAAVIGTPGSELGGGDGENAAGRH
jgi:hypothetical protein